jgi:putative ABC transport system permease protein
MDTLFQDLRFSLRLLKKSPAFTIISILTLALGIGANTAIFSVVDALLLRSLTYPNANRLVAIHEIVPKFSDFAPLLPVNALHFRAWQKNAHSFDQLILLSGNTFTLTGTGDAQRIPGARVSWNIFSTLGAKPRLGRTFLPDEDSPGRDHVVVISHRLWASRFASDPSAIGKHILLDGNTFEIIGVLPENFHFPKLSQLFAMTVAEERPDIWKPFAIRTDELDDQGDFNFACIGLLKPGVSPSQALSELNLIQANLGRQTPEKLEFFASLVPLQSQITGRSRAGLVLLLAAAAAVLLVGCVNIANLLLTQAVKRRQEMAIRSAIGACAARLTRQMWVEGLLLSSLGGLCGLLFAWGGIPIILANIPTDLPRVDEVHLNGWMLLFTFAISIVVSLLFSILPAWHITAIDPVSALKSATKSATSSTRMNRVRSLLVALETALSAACLIAAGLLLHSFFNLLDVDKGFQVKHIVTADLNLPDIRYPDLAKNISFIDSLLAQTRALPGVATAAISNHLPLTGEGGNNLVFAEDVEVPFTERPLADIRNASPDYFAALAIPLKQGRVFDDHDRGHTIALVSALAADRIWPGQNPIGKQFRFGSKDNQLIEIVGVVGDIRGVSLNRNPTLTVYVPYWQRYQNNLSLVVKTNIDPSAVTSEILTIVRQIDPDVPVSDLRTMQSIVATSVAPRRFQTTLVLIFAIAAALLAGLGIYGVVSYSTSQRTNEIGVRMALGAQRTNIASLIVRQALLPVAAGLLAGVVLALVSGRVLSSFLFGVNPLDLLTILGVVCFLGMVASVAVYFPMRRAMYISPMNALRYE